MATNLTSVFSSVTTNGSITFVPRITIEWPARADVVFHFKKYANLVEPNMEMDWSHTQTWSLPAPNDFCIRKLLRNLPEMYQDEVHGNAKVLKVEIFDPITHKLICSSNAV